jgi:hypothetical protein
VLDADWDDPAARAQTLATVPNCPNAVHGTTHRPGVKAAT